MVKIRNSIWKPIEWKQLYNEEGIGCKFDLDVYKMSEILVVPITEDEQLIIDLYDARDYQSVDDKFVFYVGWSDGDWQPRRTFLTLEDGRRFADSWFMDWTDEVCQRWVLDI